MRMLIDRQPSIENRQLAHKSSFEAERGSNAFGPRDKQQSMVEYTAN